MRCGAFSKKIRKRADKDHRRKWLVKQQKKHLRAIKSDAELRRITVASRQG